MRHKLLLLLLFAMCFCLVLDCIYVGNGAMTLPPDNLEPLPKTEFSPKNYNGQSEASNHHDYHLKYGLLEDD